MSSLHERRLARMPSAQEIVSTSALAFKSPLAQVRDLANSLPPLGPDADAAAPYRAPLQAGTHSDEPVQAAGGASTSSPAVPPLSLNLFRSNSVYSVSSVDTVSSFETETETSSEARGFSDALNARFSVSTDLSEDGLGEPPQRRVGGAETPTTPRANRSQYFDFPISGQTAEIGSLDRDDDGAVHFGGPHAGRSIPVLGPVITSTPPASRTAPAGASAPEADLQAGQLTPKRSFFVRSRPQAPSTVTSPVSQMPPPKQPVYVQDKFHHPAATHYQAEAGPGPSTSRSLAETHAAAIARAFQPHHNALDSGTREGEVPNLMPHRRSVTDMESIHGEQGSEWGDDEQDFEWVDRSGGVAINGSPPSHRSAAARSGAIGEVAAGMVKGGGKLLMSPKKSLAKLRLAVPGLHPNSAGPSSGSASGSETSPLSGDESDDLLTHAGEKRERRKLQKHIVIPRRAAPPPPPGDGSPREASRSLGSPRRTPVSITESPSSFRAGDIHDTHSHFTPQTTNNVYSRLNISPSMPTASLPLPALDPKVNSTDSHSGPPRRVPAPLMVPLRSDSDPGIKPLKPPSSNSRDSGLSLQSLSYSIYDLDGRPSPSPTLTPRPHSVSSPVPPRATTPMGTEVAFPKGSYIKVPASSLDVGEANRSGQSTGAGLGGSERGRYLSDPARSPSIDARDATPGDLLDRGVQARSKGDMPKAAWYFRQAADAGSSTGRMYWGLALRHGWGVAKDDKKAFAELKQACDESLAEGSVEVQQIGGTGNLTIQQKKALTRDLSFGMFEVANCFLDGAGVKKDPEVAISYLRFAGNLGDLASQEQLGFLLSKGGNGIKKDMKEAAKWYRMALGQGSSTIGLAWVWKEKYLT